MVAAGVIIKHTAHVELENGHLAADVLAYALPAVPALVVALEVNHVVARRAVVVLVELELVAAQAYFVFQIDSLYSCSFQIE